MRLAAAVQGGSPAVLTHWATASAERVIAFASRPEAVVVPFIGAGRANGWAASVDIVDVTRHGESVFDLKFWLACEDEAAEIVRALTGEE